MKLFLLFLLLNYEYSIQDIYHYVSTWYYHDSLSSIQRKDSILLHVDAIYFLDQSKSLNKQQ